MYRKWREIKRNPPPASTLQKRSGRKPSTGSRPSVTPARSGWKAATPDARAQPVQTVGHWKVDVNIAGVRDPLALAKLPEPERKEWQSLWGDVEACSSGPKGTPRRP